MLGITDIELLLEKADTEMLLKEEFRVQWIAQCMKYVQEVEVERAQFEDNGHNLDDFLSPQIEECTEAVLEMICKGHRPEFALFYGREIFIEDHERSMYNATEALRKFGNENGDTDIVFNDAFCAALKQGKSKHYAQYYAKAMNDEPWDEYSRCCAKTYEDAWKEALRDNQSEEYCRKYAEMASYRDYDRPYCRLYAKIYEETAKLYSDESEREHFTKYFCDEYFEYADRH
jgi:hypothetical protein